MRALDPSAPYRHRHVGHSTVPGVLVWDTGARWTRKIIWLQKGLPATMCRCKLCRRMACSYFRSWVWGLCPLKKTRGSALWASQTKDNKQPISAITRGHGAQERYPNNTRNIRVATIFCHCRSSSKLLRTAERRKNRGWAAGCSDGCSAMFL